MADQGTKSSSADPSGPLLEIKTEAEGLDLCLPNRRSTRGATFTDFSPSSQHDRGITTNASDTAEKMPPLPLAKLIVLAGCVSLLAALFLAARPDFQPDIVPFQARVGMFMVRYTMPISFFQLGVFWILYLFRKR